MASIRVFWRRALAHTRHRYCRAAVRGELGGVAPKWILVFLCRSFWILTFVCFLCRDVRHFVSFIFFYGKGRRQTRNLRVSLSIGSREW